ncbi:MAG: hypothetical protein M1839_006798 [Geoglossum umbratile]|nr:MAG: hypothetical protein M1839_006798 [Geoglossum umbratile]
MVNCLRNITIVLVHGAWHSPEYFTDLTAYFHDHCFTQVIAPSLPSTGPPVALPNFDQDVLTVRDTIKHVVDDQNEDCIVVTHSYGGVVGTEAVKGLRHRGKDGTGGGVIGMVYLTSYMLREGESMTTNGATPPPDPNAQPWVTVTKDLTTVLNPTYMFYNDLPQQKAAFWASKLRPQSIGVIYSTITYEAWRYIPTYYMVCTIDHAIPVAVQRNMIERTNGTVDVVETIHSSHSPYLSHMETVGKFIRRAAGQSVRR